MPEVSPPRAEVSQLAPSLWQAIEPMERLIALTHKDADGDTLGSALAFAHALEPLGKTVLVGSSPPVPDAWAFLPGSERVNREHLSPGLPVAIFDASDPARAGVYADLLEAAPVSINIDHHVTNTAFATLNLVCTAAASTGEIVYDLFKAWRIDIPPAAAGCLYATILSDTGGFRHDNTSEHALRAAAELVGLGADPVMIARALFKNRPPSSLRMQGRILNGLHFECDDRLVWGAVTIDDLRAAGAAPDQADGAIDQLNTVRGEELAILFKEVSPKITRVSIRSRDLVDAAALAATFGGGGHRRAAGIELAIGLEEAQMHVLKAARSLIGCP